MRESITINGRRLIDTDHGKVQAAVSDLLAPYHELLAGESVVVVPDVHYPFHPSTGLVAHPDVVEAVVSEVRSAASSDVVIGCRATSEVTTATASHVLGYPRLADRLDVEVLDLDQTDDVPRRVDISGGSLEVALPAPMAEAAVVVVPTLRTDPADGLALAMTTLARAIHPEVSTADEIWGVVTLCSPAVTLLDGSYTYLGEPRASGFLLSSSNLAAVDAVMAAAIGQAPTYLDARAVRDFEAIASVEGLSLEAVASELPSGHVGSSDPPDRLLRMAYRLYAHLSGDAVPPQFLP